MYAQKFQLGGNLIPIPSIGMGMVYSTTTLYTLYVTRKTRYNLLLTLLTFFHALCYYLG